MNPQPWKNVKYSNSSYSFFITDVLNLHMYQNVYVHAGLIIVEMKTFLPLFILFSIYHGTYGMKNLGHVKVNDG